MKKTFVILFLIFFGVFKSFTIDFDSAWLLAKVQPEVRNKIDDLLVRIDELDHDIFYIKEDLSTLESEIDTIKEHQIDPYILTGSPRVDMDLLKSMILLIEQLNNRITYHVEHVEHHFVPNIPEN